MSTNEGASASALSLEAIVAFNDEMAALVRAGVPLERGLLAASADYRGRLGAALKTIADRLAAGEPLPDAVARATQAMPAVCRAVLAAGVRSGRLADALQGLSRIGQAQIDVRRTVALALFYPVMVLILAYGLFLVGLVELFPRFAAASESLGLDQSRVVVVGERLGRTMPYWGPILPLVLVALGGVWWLAGRARALDGLGWVGGATGWFPLKGRLLGGYRMAHFTDLLAHLVEHEIPLDQAVRLAGDAAGNPRLQQAANRFADQLAQGGQPPTAARVTSDGLPPLVAWMLTSDDRQGSLASGLRHLATTYRRHADRRATAFRQILPGLMILSIGGVAVLIYGLLLFVPLNSLWTALATPTN